ncbi:Septal ring factor EnvC, activator of murein hydrolases AmiA and AmiB [Flavobacteriaceae bacterium MAR_2010_188]|nr:Septal ring factor EnvC, activator of murein hydrolases AmiA and AmiB [Flavobacteriaceae bacterium MAR_2010_188]
MTYQNNRLLFSFIFLFVCFNLIAQSAKQKELEVRRIEIQKEIKQINALLYSDKKKEKSVLSLVEDLNYKVRVRQDLIKVTNDQANLLTREINHNQKQISDLRKQLAQLKEEYAAMIVKSYKSRSDQSRVMFLLSSENFKQAYKRLQYIKQYRDHQTDQANEIKAKTQELQDLNLSLLQQKEDKEKLVAESRIAKTRLEEDLKEHEKLMLSIRKNLTVYSKQIKQKQQEADKIDREIDRLIKEAIAASNKKAGKSSTKSTFELTPEAKALAANFESNKGKLPWPVERGVVKVGYGSQHSPIDKTVPIVSNGVRIATEEGAKARAVFEGTVLSIIVMKKGNPTILVQHGNYITAYKNLSKIYVKIGDKVTTKQDIGEVFTDRIAGETMLSFSIFKNTSTQDPSAWISGM